MMIDSDGAERFLSQKRVAVVGASDEPRNFGRSVYGELRRRGYEVAAVNPNASTVMGDACHPDLASLPAPVDGAIVMVRAEKAVGVVQECIDEGIGHVWLFKGLGGKSAVSDEAVELCRANGVEVVAGACPFMFMAPVGGVHRIHRALRHVNRSVRRAA